MAGSGFLTADNGLDFVAGLAGAVVFRGAFGAGSVAAWGAIFEAGFAAIFVSGFMALLGLAGVCALAGTVLGKSAPVTGFTSVFGDAAEGVLVLAVDMTIFEFNGAYSLHR